MFLVGLAVAFGHHGLNKHLSGHTVTSDAAGWGSASVYSQRGASALATAFAFLFRTCMAAAIGTAFVQGAWRVAQDRAVSVSGLDSLFSATSNIRAFLSLDFLRAGRFWIVLAAALWCLPLVAIFTPGALSVTSELVFTSAACTVPTMDLSQASSLFYNGTFLFSVSRPETHMRCK